MGDRGIRYVVAVGLLAPLGGCTDKELDASGVAYGEPCTVMRSLDAVPCGQGLVCEPIAGADGARVCVEPVEIHGRVLDAVTGAPIGGAQLVATDESGAPASSVARSADDGSYVLPVSVARQADGSPAEAPQWMLLVAAAGYQPVPYGVRPSLPVDAADAQDGVIDNGATTVALLPRPDGVPDGVTIRGQVEQVPPTGVLVVAEGIEDVAPTIADLDGRFTLFDVPAGTVTVRGYGAGLELEPATLQVAGEDVDDVVLRVSTDDPGQLATVEGSVTIVDAGGDRATSVVLVPAAAYHPGLERGPAVPGLRAPPAPQPPSVDGAFEIAGVPTGRYVVLAALENDLLVRDPDATIAGTQIPEIEVVAGEVVSLPESFKLTRALAVVSPGAEATEVVGSTPTFVWADDSSEDRYSIVVFDVLGDEVWRDDAIPKVSGSAEVRVDYAGPPLVSEAYYQFRATAWRDGATESTALSRTEDLRGVFVVQ